MFQPELDAPRPPRPEAEWLEGHVEAKPSVDGVCLVVHVARPVDDPRFAPRKWRP